LVGDAAVITDMLPEVRKETRDVLMEINDRINLYANTVIMRLLNPPQEEAPVEAGSV